MSRIYYIFSDEKWLTEWREIIEIPDGQIIAEFEYYDSKMTEPCKLYYNSGDLFFEGYLVNGYRQGLGTEYDKSGNIMNEGYFSNGCKSSYVEKVIGGGGWLLEGTRY